MRETAPAPATDRGDARGDGLGEGRAHRTNNHRPAQQAVPPRRCPDSPDGACAYPLTCPCRGAAMLRKVADLIERADRGMEIAAGQLGISTLLAFDIVVFDLETRRSLTPEQRAAREERVR